MNIKSKTENIMTPLEIDVLLHCHVRPAPHPRINAPAVVEAIEMFLDKGIIERHSACNRAFLNVGMYYQTTDRGKAIVKLLCSTPFPTQKWVDQNNKIIEI